MKKWEPDNYDKSVLQFRTAIAMFRGLLPLIGNENILDVGSGTGKVTDYISRQVPNGKVIGLDCSKEMVQYSTKKYNSQNLKFVERNVLDMSYKQCFHLIVSFWTLSWVENQALALIKIVNALKPNGQMFLMYPLRHDAYDVADQMLKTP